MSTGLYSHPGYQPAPHYAALLVTGWLGQTKNGTYTIQGFPLRLDPARFPAAQVNTRVTLSARPFTDQWGRVTELGAVTRLASAVSTARNGMRFTALGRIRRVDLGEQLMILHVYRNGHGGKSFSLRIRGTPSNLAFISPAWSVTQVTGSLIGPMLIVEQAQPHRGPASCGKWAEVWRVREELRSQLLSFPDLPGSGEHLVQSHGGRYYFRGKPFKRSIFEDLVRAGVLWREV